jgi:hypothetical protein
MDAFRYDDLPALMPASEGPTTRMIRRSGPAPTACAKWASAMLKILTQQEPTLSLLFRDEEIHRHKAIHSEALHE